MIVPACTPPERPTIVGVTPIGSLKNALGGFTSGEWSQGMVDASAFTIDAAVAAVNPVGSSMSWGYELLIEHCGPLTDLLDELAVDPHQARANAGVLAAVAGSLESEVRRLGIVRFDDFLGESAQAHARARAELLEEMAATAEAVRETGRAMADAATLVAAVRETVRGMIADVMAGATLGVAAAGLSGGTLAPFIATAVGAHVTSCVYRLGPTIHRLMAAMAHLDQLLVGTARALADLRTRRPVRRPTESVSARPRVTRWREATDQRYRNALDIDTYRPRVPTADAVNDALVDRAVSFTSKGLAASTQTEREVEKTVEAAGVP